MTTLTETHCKDCGVPQVDGVFHHLRKCPRFHRTVAEHYEKVAKEAKWARRKEWVGYYGNPLTFIRWINDDWERQLFFYGLPVMLVLIWFFFTLVEPS